MFSPLKLKDKVFYGWLVLAAFVIAGTSLWGIRSSFGVFFKSIESEFELGRAATSSIFSLYMVIGSAFAFVGGWALDKYGPRVTVLLLGLSAGLGLVLTGWTSSLWQLFLTYSLLTAIGTGSIYVVVMSTVSRWFVKRRGLALGIASIGAGSGSVVMAPFAAYLISHLGWRMACVALGLVVWVVVIPMSRLLKRDPQEMGLLPDGAKSSSKGAAAIPDAISAEKGLHPPDLSLTQVLRVRSFWFFWFVFLLHAFNLFMVLTHVVPYATDMGITDGDAAAIISLIGGGSVVTRVLLGIVADRQGRKLTAIICSLLQGGAMVWLVWSRELWMFYVFALVFGFSYGGSGPLITALVSDTFGVSRIGAVLGMLEIGFGIGAALGPAAGGLIFDVTSNYSLAFGSGALSISAVALFLALTRQQRSDSLKNRV